MRIITICSLISLFMVFAISPSPAAEPADHICFRKIDADHNGKVTPNEFARYYPDDPEQFEAADSDGNGLLTHAEYHDMLGHGARDSE